MSERPVRVVVADDHELFLTSLTALLDRDERLSVVGTAADGREVIDVASAAEPDLVVVDVLMPGLDGIEATRRLQALRPDLPVVVISGVRDDKLEREAREAGAAGVLAKEAFARDLKGAIAFLARLGRRVR